MINKEEERTTMLQELMNAGLISTTTIIDSRRIGRVERAINEDQFLKELEDNPTISSLEQREQLRIKQGSVVSFSVLRGRSYC